jgi:alcohol dehydrogenase
MTFSAFHLVNKLIMGSGSIRELPAQVERLRGKKILLITDRGLVNTPIPDRILSLLHHYDVSVYSDVEPDPSIETVIKCADYVKQNQFDLLIGLGGGSPLDVTKSVSVLATNTGDVYEYLGIEKVPSRGLPKILIPTTAGTGSEVTNVAVLSLKEQKTKKGIVSTFLFADASIVDPELTLNLPSAITASTGMDALTHAIEAYASRFAQPLTDFFALEAIRLISSSLRTAVHNGQNIEAREKMMMGSLYAGIAFGSAATGMVHGLAMPLGGLFGIAHGIANAVLLPYVMEFNMVSSVERYKHIAEAMGEKVDHLSDREAAERSIMAVRTLSKDIHIPQYLDDLGITRDSIPAIAADGMTNDRQIKPNPRQVTYDDLVQILENTFRR